MMVITEAQLPPLKGFVEVEVEGERVYREIASGRLYTPSAAHVIASSTGRYTPVELAQQTITDLDLELIQMGQEMTDLELMILEGNYV